MTELFKIMRSLSQGRSLLRTMMNFELAGISLSGEVLDLGSGHDRNQYLLFKDISGAAISGIDFKLPSAAAIDLEHDALPFADGTKDAVLMLNLLEHIYRHGHVLSEARRVLKTGGRLIGFVPFLINVHPDPHDYFRYTGECLEKLLQEYGYEDVSVREVGFGPCSANFNNLVLSLPVWLRPALFPLYYALDRALLYWRPNMRQRFPLGYMFFGRKPDKLQAP